MNRSIRRLTLCLVCIYLFIHTIRAFHSSKWPLRLSRRSAVANIASKLWNTDRFGSILRMSTVDEKVGSTTSAGTVTILRCDGLTKSFTGTPQFQDISFVMGKGQRIGLIGVNGAGKSTFLKCLARKDSPDSGYIDQAANTNIVYVDQEPDWGSCLVYEAIFSEKTPQAAAVRKYMKASGPLASGEDTELTDALDAMEEAQAWEYQTLGLSIAEKLNIKEDKLYRDVDSLSGGERKRVGLSSALLLQPDILLLDEPTNHLDADALEWLADFLKPGGREKDMSMLLVTHDRYFLERVCSEIVELDRASLYRYPGNYAKYLELKASRLAAEDAETDQAKGRSADLKPIGLSTPEDKEKQKRLGGVVAEFQSACYEMHGKTLLNGFTYNFRQRDRIGVCGPNGVGKSTFLKILIGQLALSSGSMRLGETVRVGYYDQIGLQLTPEQEKQPVLKFVQEAVEMAGKSDDKPKSSSGPRLVVSENKNVGRRKLLAGKEATINVEMQEDYSKSSAVSEQDARKLLSQFQFPSKRWYDRIGQLSGGERRRIQLLQVLAKAPNFLILDEPSNDLDLATLTALEEYLTETFDGCLIVVSHDNFFVNHVCEHLFVFEGDGIVRDFQGSYTDYLEYRRDQSLERSKREKDTVNKDIDTKNQIPAMKSLETTADDEKSRETSTNSKKSSSSTSSSSLSYNERKEFNKLEKEMNKLSSQIKDFETQIASADVSIGYSVLADWTKQMEELRGILAEKEEKWMLLAEKDV